MGKQENRYIHLKDKELRIGILGITGFPYKQGAENQKTKLICEALSMQNHRVYCINRRSYILHEHSCSGHISKNVIYANSSGQTIRQKNIFIRNIRKVYAFWNEIFLIKRFHINIALITTRNFSLLLKYILLSKIFSFKTVHILVEFASKRPDRQNIRFLLNDFLFEKYAFRLIDGLMPISELLKDFALKINSNLRILKLPVLVDFNLIDSIPPIKRDIRYFLFCGHVAYIDTINIIIDSFRLLNNPALKLVLILHGNNQVIQTIKNENNLRLKEQLIVLTNLSYRDLIGYYKSAEALLIPLLNTYMDKARFPHKIGEYVAAKRPVITTNIGEVNYYFQDSVNALITNYMNQKESMAEKMKFVLDHPSDADNIGLNGGKVGKSHFDLTQNGIRMSNFLLEIIAD